MLRLSVGPSTVDKDAETVRKALLEVMNEAAEGILKIYAYPSVDSIVASSLLFRELSRGGRRISLSISSLPPQRVEEPSILVGYGSLSYGNREAEARILAISQKGMKAIPPAGATYVEVEGSASSMVAILLGIDINESVSLVPLAGSYDSPYVDEYGRFHGLDSVLLTRLRMRSELAIDMMTTVKVYKPHLRSVCEALVLTSNPFYGGISGRSCDALSSLKDVLDRLQGSLSKDDIGRLAEALLDHLRRQYKREVDPAEILGGIVVSRAQGAIMSDAREVRDAIVFTAEAASDVYYASAIVLDAENEYPVAESRLESFSKRLAELTSLKPERNRGWKSFPLYEVELSKGDSPTLLWGALRMAGLIEKESVLSFKREDRRAVSILQLDAALGRGKGAELVASGLAEEEGGLLYLSAGQR